MNKSTVNCPLCAEEIPRAAIKCKHCEAALVDADASPTRVPMNPPTGYATSWSVLFRCGPGYWKTKPVFWLAWVIGLLATPVYGLGLGIWAYLFLAAAASRGEWHTQEIEGAIEGSHL